jgi:general secretion pathway protein D
MAAQSAWAQTPAPAKGNASEPPPGFVRLNLQGNIKLQALIDIVGQRLGIKCIYSTPIGERTINVRAPGDVPTDALPALLNSVLRMENLALVDADVPGWKRIIDAGEMPAAAQPGQAQEVLDRSGAATPVTQTFMLEHIAASQLATIIRPFLKQPGSSVVAVAESNVLVVTDYASTVLTVERLIKLIDRPRGEVVHEFYAVANTEAGKLAEQVKTMLPGRPSGAPAGAAPLVGVELFSETRTNQIVIVGPRALVDQALELLKRFDVSLGTTSKVYRFQYVKADRADRILKSFLPPQDMERAYKSSVDTDGNMLVVRATPEVHQRIDELQRQLDVPVKAQDSPIRIYKLKNANALDVLYTLLALQEAAGTPGVLGGGQSASMPAMPAKDGAKPEGASPLNININSSPTNQYPLNPAPFAAAQASQALLGATRPFAMPLAPSEDLTGSYENVQQARRDRWSGVLAPQLATGGAAVLPGGARVSANVATNSLIIIAPAEMQDRYAQLIQSLDVRQPQVLIEAKIIAIDTSDSFTLGVEFSGGDRSGLKRLFAFNSFGLSEVDPITGALKIIPSTGFNGTMVNPDVADIVVKALTTHSRARVLAAPRILVNDNSTGQLESVTSIPFESVNASQTVSTTSLGGSQQAGTIITVTPHIKEDQHLQLEFSVEFSTFGKSTVSATLPPPREIDRVGSAVTMPNGQTVIVGGLKRTGQASTTTGVPLLERIPIVRDLTSLNERDAKCTSFFLFIRPIILVDDRFADLKHLSQREACSAGIEGEHPTSRPMIME